MPHLIARLSNGEQRVIAIDRAEMVLGRAPSCDVPLPDEKKLSRRHLLIQFLDGMLWAEDLGSANGTRYRKQRIDRRMILEGDVLRVGELRLRFSYRDAPADGDAGAADDEEADETAVGAPGESPGGSEAPVPPEPSATASGSASGSGSASMTDIANTIANEPARTRPVAVDASAGAPPPGAVAAPPGVPLGDGDATPPAGSPMPSPTAPPVDVPSSVAAPPPRRATGHLPGAGASSPPPAGASPGRVSAPPPTRKDPMVGQLLAGYQLEERIGRGGMGTVYRARHTVMDTLVAVKMIRGDVDDESRARFFREARAAFGLAHPNIVRVLHADIAPDGRPFLVMDYVDGVSMRRYVPDGGMPDEVVARQLVQIAAGLAAAHGAGLVHRDIKPDNILVEAGTLRPRITDFGLTRMVDSDSGITRTGLYGTPAFMPPEQWEEGGSVDPRADIYALGVTGYFMLSGDIPYPSRDAVTIMQHNIRRDRIPLEQAAPDVDPDLADIIDAMMEWDVTLRYQRIVDLQADLTDWLRGA